MKIEDGKNRNQLCIRIDPATQAGLNALALAQDRSRGYIIRHLIRKAVNEQLPELPGQGGDWGQPIKGAA